MSLLDLQVPSDRVDVILPENEWGYNDERGEDTRENFMGLESSRSFPDELWIEPREWKDFAESVEKAKGFGRDYRPRYTHQGRSHECTSHSDDYNSQICYARMLLNPSEVVYTSPLSIYCRVNPRQYGGASIMAVMREHERRGVLPGRIGPGGIDQSTRFSHVLHGSSGGTSIDTMQSGDWVTERDFPAGWESTAKLFRPNEIIVPDTWEQGVCLLLHGFGVSVGRNGHAICYNAIGWRRGDPSEKPMAPYADSYDVDRVDSFERMRGCIGNGYSYTSMMVLPDEYATT